MRRLALAALVLASALGAHANEIRPRPDVGVLVPVDPHEHERLHWVGRRRHRLVPGTVTINGDRTRAISTLAGSPIATACSPTSASRTTSCRT